MVGVGVKVCLRNPNREVEVAGPWGRWPSFVSLGTTGKPCS